MSPTTENPPDSIESVLQAQLECYRRLDRLAGLQHECVEREETDGLLAVLAKRQEVIEKVTRLDALLAAIRKNGTTLDAPDRTRCEALVEQITALLRRINESDQRDSIILQQRKHLTHQQLNHAARGSVAGRAYAAAGSPQAARMDLSR